MLNATDDGVLITDSTGTIEFVNKAFEKITGYNLTEVLGRNPSMLKSGEQDFEFYKDMMQHAAIKDIPTRASLSTAAKIMKNLLR